MQLQVLDCDYVMLSAPVIRLFCKDADGKAACVFVNKFFPYFYLKPFDDDAAKKIKESAAALAIASIEEVERFLPIGYQEKPAKLLKITGKDPSRIPEIKESLRRYGETFEADVLFKYRFMVDNSIKGMQWIDVEGRAVHTRTVKCRAIEASSIKPIHKDENAPLRYLSLDIECMSDSDERLPLPEKDPIVIISMVFHPDYKGMHALTLTLKHVKNKNCLFFSSEQDMLKKLIDVFDEFDPDILVGYNINNYDLPYLIKRLETLKLKKDLGRAEKPAFCRKLQHTHAPSIIGRVVVDPFDILKRDPWVKFKRYDLRTVSRALLGEEKIDIGGIREMRNLWNGSGAEKFIEYSRRDSELALKIIIEKNMLDKFFELAKISGLLLQDALGGQTQRHECKLLHEFREAKTVLPCRPDSTELIKRKRERERLGLKGALVLEPKTGFHKQGCTLVLDFSSLYPSIIRTFNICPTTFCLSEHVAAEQTAEDKIITTPHGAKFVKAEVKEGVLPKILKELIEARAAVKKQMKTERDAERKRILNAKQLALKDMSNSLYGYTAYVRARLYVLDVANSITAYGREIITKTKQLIEGHFPVSVIYSDTDSVFINTDLQDLDKAEKYGEEISSYVTKALLGVLELKFEKIYKTFLILTKKHYIGWKFERDADGWKDKLEMKGIETVRRDWCELVSDTMVEVLNIILKEADIQKAAKYVRGVLESLSEGRVPLEKLIIIKGITKALDAYDGVQPHVELAKKIRIREPTRTPIVGERLQFVIVKGNQLLSKRAEDPEFVKAKKLQIDSQYYVENQLLPPIERIFEVCGVARAELIEGSRQKRLAELFRQQPCSPDVAVLSGFDAIVCRKCSFSFRRPPLQGCCPSCRSQLYFSQNGSIGKTVKIANADTIHA